MKLLILLLLPVIIKATTCNECSCVDANGYATIDSDTAEFTNCNDIKHAIVSEGVTKIFTIAFRNCYNLETVVLPSTLTTIEWQSFAYTNKLTSLVIPDGVTEIAHNAFYRAGLTSITLPTTITTWGSAEFEYADDLIQLCGVDVSFYSSVSFPTSLDQSTQEPCTSPTCPDGTSNVNWCFTPLFTCNPGEGNDGVSCTPCTDSQHSDGTTTCQSDTVTSCSPGEEFSDGGASADGSCTPCTASQHSDGTVCQSDTVTSCTDGIFDDGGPTSDGSCADLEITYDGNTYEVCDGTSTRVVWNGYHNIQEVTETGYDTYSSGEHVGSEIHGFENSGHKELVSGLHASEGQTRYFVCTQHPSSKFKTTCSPAPSAASQDFSFKVGWNWIGMCAISEDLPINDFLPDIWEQGDTILTQNEGSVTYFPAQTGWAGGWYPPTAQLSHFKRGVVYKFKKATAVNATYPESRRRFLRNNRI